MVVLYIGPGMGGGVIAVILGVFLSIFGGLFAIIWFPVKRLIRKMKSKSK